MSPTQAQHFDGRTDAQGRFEWGAAPAERVPFWITAEGYVSGQVIWLTAGGQEAVITLRPAVDVTIQAVDAETGAAIPRFRIEIATRDPSTGGFRWGQPTGRTAPRKFQTVLEAEKGPYHFRISAEGYAPARFLVPNVRTVLRKTIKLEKAAK
jgi:hypothetical protein